MDVNFRITFMEYSETPYSFPNDRGQVVSGTSRKFKGFYDAGNGRVVNIEFKLPKEPTEAMLSKCRGYVKGTNVDVLADMTLEPFISQQNRTISSQNFNANFEYVDSKPVESLDASVNRQLDELSKASGGKQKNKDANGVPY